MRAGKQRERCADSCTARGQQPAGEVKKMLAFFWKLVYNR